MIRDFIFFSVDSIDDHEDCFSMSDFAFNFLPSSTDRDEVAVTGKEKVIPNNSSNEKKSSIKEQKERRPVEWISNLSELLLDRSQAEIVYHEVPLTIHDAGGSPLLSPLHRVDEETCSFVEPSSIKADKETWRKTDLEPGVYEGGMKVWECSIDLVIYLAKHSDLFLTKGHVLELGCGHGLPACYVLREGLRRRKESNSDASGQPLMVVFADYNDFVLKDVTLSNIVINTAHIQDAKQVIPHVKLVAGDWLELSDELRKGSTQDTSVPFDGKFDLILAAETLYSEEAARETALFVARHLCPDTGVALVATKRYYFGVGGGTDAFQEACKKSVLGTGMELRVDVAQVYDNGSGNIREMLQVKVERRFPVEELQES